MAGPTLFDDPEPPVAPCPHNRPTKEGYIGFVRASADTCFVCNHAALSYAMRDMATREEIRDRSGCKVLRVVPRPPEESARLHALLDDHGVPPIDAPWSARVAWAALSQRSRLKP